MRRGITLLELLVVVAIVGMLVAAASPHVQDFVAGSRRAKAFADLDLLKSSATKHNFATESPIERLEELEGRYVRDIRTLRDPWGNPYRLDTAELAVYSCGPNGRDEHGRGDDLTRHYRVPAYVVRIGNRNSEYSPDSPTAVVRPGDDGPLSTGDGGSPLSGR